MTTYAIPPTAVAGQGLSAADWNTKVRDSIEDVAKPKRCKVNRTTAFSIPNNVNTAITWVNEEWDSDSMWAPGAPTLIQAPHTGLYLATLSLQFAIAAAGARHFGITKNGLTYVASFNGVGSATWFIGGTVSGLVQLLAGDNVQASAYQNSGAALNIDATYPVSLSLIEVSRSW